MLYVFGYGKNWWKNDGKLLIFIMCLKKQKKEKKKRHKSKFTLWKEKKWKVEKKEWKTKEVRNEVSISED